MRDIVGKYRTYARLEYNRVEVVYLKRVTPDIHCNECFRIWYFSPED